MMDDKATVVSDVVLPVEIVALKHLKTKAGTPVMVRCENRDHMKFYDATKSLPGLKPRDAMAEDPVIGDPALAEQLARESLAFCEPLIELCTVLYDEHGNEVSPAFWFDPAKPRHSLSLPGRVLNEEDKLAMLNAILRVGGYVGGAAESAGFSTGEREGSGNGGGAAGAHPGVESGPIGPASIIAPGDDPARVA